MKQERYFSSADDVMFYNPIVRFLAKIFGNEKFVFRCKSCNKIPTELISGECKTCIKTKKNE